jgi:hypothetical protein
MQKLGEGEVVNVAVLALMLVAIVGGLAIVLYWERPIPLGQLKAELATLPAEMRVRTFDYLRSSHETMFDSYEPGDPLTWNRLRKAKADARARIRAEAEDARETRMRSVRVAVLDDMALNVSGFDAQR